MSIPPYFNAVYQELKIVAIELYGSDVKVIREPVRRKPANVKPFFCMDEDGTVITNQSTRGAVTEFSRKSRQKLAFIVQNTECTFDRMVTLTYPSEYPKSGKIVKKQLNAFLQYLRRKEVDNYLWFMEFQRRGAPHFHILLDGGKPIAGLDISLRWYAIVGSGDIAHYHAGTRIERGRSRRGLHKYAVKYAQKVHQKDVPDTFHDVGRLWGCSRGVRPKAIKRIKVDSEKGLSSLLEKWEYKGKEKEGYSVLFNAAPAIIAHLESLGIDVDSISTKP